MSKLISTFLQINNLAVRAEDSRQLLEQACSLLVDNCGYSMVWIKLTTHGGLLAYAGKEEGYLREILLDEREGWIDGTPAAVVYGTGQAVIIEDIAREPPGSAWRSQALERRYGAMAIFPLLQDGGKLGLLGIVSEKPNIFDQEEILLLQGLADNLANAIDNLELRKKQIALNAAAENMLDGLLIVDLNGDILYANQAVKKILSPLGGDLPDRNVRGLLEMDGHQADLDVYRQALLELGVLNAEFDVQYALPKPIHIAVRAALVHQGQNQAPQVVVSIRDISHNLQYEHKLLTLNRVATEYVQIRDPEELMRSFLIASVELMQAWASAIFMIKNNTGYEPILYNLPLEYAQRVISNLQGMPGGTALRTHQPVYVSDVLNDPQYGEHIHFMADYGVRALLILPIIHQEQPIGALVVYYNQPYSFTENDVQLGLTLAHTLAITIQNARLYQAEYSQRQLAVALAQAAASINRLLNLDDVLDQILEQVLRVTACRSANIMLIEGDNARLVCARGYDSVPEHLRAFEQGLSLKIYTLQHMLNTRQPIIILDTYQDEHWTATQGTEWIRSYAGAPLQVADQVVGFLSVDSDQPNFMTEEVMHRLQALADYAAMAIQNARLYTRLQAYATELEDRVLERTAELEAAKNRIESILASVPDAVFVLDENNQPIHANQAGEMLLLHAHHLELDLFSPKFLAKLQSAGLMAEEAVLEAEGRAYQALASPIPVDQERVGLVVVFRDVTRFRELDQMKTHFVSDVSHELRTPLTNLMLYIDLLSGLDKTGQSKPYLDTLKRETHRLGHLIEDLLTISRLEAGRVEINCKPTDINRLLAELVADRAMMAQQRSLRLAYEPAVELPLALADINLLNQAISNLLTNAINYTPPGGTIVLSSGISQQEDNAWVLIHVTDSGVGIQEDELPHVFDRFYRGLASRQTGSPGTGLGLAISKEIVTRLQGKITVESQPQVGSVFTVWLKAVL
ncbi:MAG: GAF domain-containing protein [Anaerolineales bacterium]|nr:GAF domain-containing protein [Anaerolineales bacterium]